MPYELIITEKPNAALKLANALATGKAIKKNIKGVPYYEVTHGNKDLVVGCAVGHLYTVAEKEKKKGWTYPVFDIEWEETGKAKKESAYTKKYLSVIKKLAKDANEFTVATDYDIEGEVIGLNVVRFACKQKDANRMKFSTLTKYDLIEAYEKRSKTLDWGQALAGETRHFLDWMYGINLSRALTLSIKHATGRYKILSSGRVQGPALKIIVDREKEIMAFKPEPFWELELKGAVAGGDVDAQHVENPFWNKEKASKVLEKIKPEKKAKVKSVTRSEFRQAPPTPFDLTTLQTEAYRTLHISPSQTLELAQNLYLDGAISYPRTSSQQLPPAIGYKKIIDALRKIEGYGLECAKLLAKASLTPNNGKKTDPAHPAIYPTGSKPSLRGKELQLFDLIVRRFLATFGDPALRETLKLIIDVKEEEFVAKGTRTKEKGWHDLYGKYATQKEEELPKAAEGDTVDVKELLMHDKETQPPKRYTQASIIKELEKKGLGTKATRANIIDNLFQRGYATDRAIRATQLGIRTVDTLLKYSPDILDEELTRNIELEMESIREGKKKEEEVLASAKEVLNKTLAKFKDNEKNIGTELLEATEETEREMSLIGKCTVCKGNLVIKRGKFGKFIACDNYPDCSMTFKLPATGMIKPTKKVCEECNHPIIMVINRGKRPQEVCINPDCPGKRSEDKEAQKEADKVESGEIEKKCPKCGKLMALRKSVYGSFYGCTGYPKCRHTENLDGSHNGGKKKFGKKEENKE
ncbi:DNA topoisomerase I [Candidatus Woesearchaeota archaeon]|nr:DNA topoisomerase I [Candidatus Woesearchaeota archaeon]